MSRLPRLRLDIPVRRAGGKVRSWAGALARLGPRLGGRLWPLRPGHAAAALALAVAAAGLGSLAFQSGLAARLPGPLDWGSAAAVLARDARPGDVVALAPPWAQRARLALPASLPVLALPGYQGEALLGVRRVWLLSLPDAPGADREIARQLAGRASGGEAPQRLGALELRRYDLAAPELPLAFLPDRLAGARVTVGEEECQPAGGGFRCGAAGASREVRAVGGRPRPCIVLRAEPGAALSLTLPAAPLGRVLRGHAGLVDGSAGPATLAVRAAGHEVSLPLDGPGWRAFELRGGEPQDVVLTARASGPSLVCVDAAALP